MMKRSAVLFWFSSVRVRFAPSPTGAMHMGNLRTAYFNYLFAKKHDGKLILRIEDTDKDRQVENSIENIQQTLKWVGIVPDQSPQRGGQYAPYIQSQRLHIYQEVVKQLLQQQYAYHCFCQYQNQKGHASQSYPGTCRHLSHAEVLSQLVQNKPFAIRLRSDIKPQPKSMIDLVYGQVSFGSFNDFVIVKSDSMPTFHLANVVDDWKMKITHVLRGEEWLTNTNKHIYLYDLLGYEAPKFAHLPLIQNMQGKKLAKRDSSSSLENIVRMDYEILAIKNMLFRLGIPRKEEIKEEEDVNLKKKKKKVSFSTAFILSDEDLVKQVQFLISQFNFQNISKHPVKLDPKYFAHLNKLALRLGWEKTNWMKKQFELNVEGSEDDKKQAMEALVGRARKFITNHEKFSNIGIYHIIESILDRLTFISDIQQYQYFFSPPNYQYHQLDFVKLYGEHSQLIEEIVAETKHPRVINSPSFQVERNRAIIESLYLMFKNLLEGITEENQFIEEVITERMDEMIADKWKPAEVYNLLRFIITGSKNAFNIQKTCELIGKEEVLKRIIYFIDM